MKILHVNFSDTDGGAAIAVKRLHESLIENGIDSTLLVCESFDVIETNPTVAMQLTHILFFRISLFF